VPEGAADLRPCGVHWRATVDAGTGALLCPRCRAGRAVQERELAGYPPVWAAWRAKAGLPVAAPPGHDPACPAPIEPPTLRPALLSPRPGAVIEAPRDGRAPLVVRVLASDPSARLRIWLDGALAGEAPSGAPTSLSVVPGRHRLAVVDAAGRTAEAEFEARPGARP
jgi:membrane carboxypeptidase/penicillin-binding protein PbpC